MLTKIINGWKYDFSLLKKDTLLLLMYSWYRTTMRTYKTLIPYYAILCIFCYGLRKLNSSLFKSIEQFVLTVTLFFIFVVARPSVEYKNISTVLNKVKTHLLKSYFILALMLLVIVLFYLIPMHTYIMFFCSSLLTVIINTSLLFSTLFFLDSHGSKADLIASLKKGFWMSALNIPIVLCGSLIPIAAVYMMKVLMKYYLPEFVIVMLTMPTVIAHFTILYVKLVHDQCDLYFGRNKL
jgi:hypothetical protein